MPAADGRDVVLVVDDNEAFVHLVTTLLEKEGYLVVAVADGQSAVEAVDREHPDLVVLDLDLPGMSGLEVLPRIRPRLSEPVIVVSGIETERERVLAFELGADDYVVKPFLPREFAARVRAVLRRARGARAATYRFDSLEIRLAAQEVTVDGAPVALSPREFALLAYLAARPGQVVTRQQLLRDVWGQGEWGDPATVTEHVRRLRRKIEPDPARPRWIRSVRGSGYRFDPG